MALRLSKNLNSAYIEAMNQLRSKRERKTIVAYVESYDDIFFWRKLLSELETDTFTFEVMLPSKQCLSKGKKEVLRNILGDQLGKYMIACVDADYDYLLQGTTHTSQRVCEDPCVFHTYVYAIENFRCYAPTLRNVCVLATLNDHISFDIPTFMQLYSKAIWPLFVWNVWAYKYGVHRSFSLMHFYHIVQLHSMDYHHPERTLAQIQKAVNRKIAWMQRKFPQAKVSYKPLLKELLSLGLTPETTYLYIRGHDLLEGVVCPLLHGLCARLRREKENEIHRLAVHKQQAQNELQGYRHAATPLEDVLRRHSLFTDCPQYKRVKSDIQQLMEHLHEGK